MIEGLHYCESIPIQVEHKELKLLQHPGVMHILNKKWNTFWTASLHSPTNCLLPYGDPIVDLSASSCHFLKSYSRYDDIELLSLCIASSSSKTCFIDHYRFQDSIVYSSWSYHSCCCGSCLGAGGTTLSKMSQKYKESQGSVFSCSKRV